MSPVPRALTRARLWTSGLLTASTLLVGGVGIHLAQDHAQSVAAASSTSSSGSSTSGTTGTDDSTSLDSGSTSTGSGDDGSGSSNQSSGFAQVAPLGGSGGQAQSGSGGS